LDGEGVDAGWMLVDAVRKFDLFIHNPRVGKDHKRPMEIARGGCILINIE
jgi:hypothetical protein